MLREERGGDGCPGDGMKSLRPLRPECQKWPEEIVLGRQRELALLFPANDASLDTGPTSGGRGFISGQGTREAATAVSPFLWSFGC